MERKSWACTVFTQLFLCVALYFALNLGQPQKLGGNRRMPRSGRIRGAGNGVLDTYFVTVRGGSRSQHQQARLLKMIDKVSNAFDAKFVINISELGEDDPLLQNGTQNFSTLGRIPWYTTKASNENNGYFHEQIKMLFGKTLDIVGINTGLFTDLKSEGSSNILVHEQYGWIARTLEAIKGDWLIVVGFHPSFSWNAKMDQAEENPDPMCLHDLLAKSGVDVYLSGMRARSTTFLDGISYLGNPSSALKKHHVASSYGTESISLRYPFLSILSFSIWSSLLSAISFSVLELGTVYYAEK